MIDLVGIHLGGAEAPIEGGGGGSTPTPTPLPSAGRPFVDKKDFQFDPVTHVVTLRARVADAGEVKAENVIGDPNYFPIPGIPTQLTGVLHLYNLKNSSGEDLLVDFGGTSGQVSVNRQLELIVVRGTYDAGRDAALYTRPAMFEGDELKSTGKLSIVYKASGRPARLIVTADARYSRTWEDYILIEQSFEVLPDTAP